MDPLLARASAVHEPPIPVLEERALETMVERLSFVGKLHDDCCKIGEKPNVNFWSIARQRIL
jgi:hypothetical protein